MHTVATILVLAIWVGSTCGGDPYRQATVRSIVEEAAPAPTVRVQGTVSYCDSNRRLVCIQDGAFGLSTRIPADCRPLRPGQRVELAGRIVSRYFLDATELRALGEDSLPAATIINANDFTGGRAVNVRVALSGVVRSVAIEDDRPSLQLLSGRTRIRVIVSEPIRYAAGCERLVDAEVRVAGICGPSDNDHKKADETTILVQSLRDVEITREAPDSPFQLPLTSAANLPNWGDHRVRIDGRASGPVVDRILQLEAYGRTVRVAVSTPVLARAGERFEAVGFPSLRDGTAFLDDAVVRGFAPRRGVDAALARPNDLLPIIPSVSDLRRLPIDDAKRGSPVRIQGILTYYDPSDRSMFVHDGNEGVFVVAPADIPRPAHGTVLIVDGFTDAGKFSPVIHATRVVALRDGRLPEAPKARLLRFGRRPRGRPVGRNRGGGPRRRPGRLELDAPAWSSNSPGQSSRCPSRDSTTVHRRNPSHSSSLRQPGEQSSPMGRIGVPRSIG